MAVFLNVYRTGILTNSINAGATAITLLNTISAVIQSGLPQVTWNLMNSGTLFVQYMNRSGMSNLEAFSMQVSGSLP